MVWARCSKRVLYCINSLEIFVVTLLLPQGLFQKKANRGGAGGGLRTWNFQRDWKNRIWKLQESIKKRSGISRHDQEKNSVKFPWFLVSGLGNSNGCDIIWWNFQEWSFILSGIYKGKVPLSKKYVLNTPCLDLFWNNPIQEHMQRNKS